VYGFLKASLGFSRVGLGANSNMGKGTNAALPRHGKKHHDWIAWPRKNQQKEREQVGLRDGNLSADSRHFGCWAKHDKHK
jgi:hypothetical protein